MGPRVAVVMAAYNAAQFIGAALASVRSQTLQDFAVVVVDAGSTDGTSQVVEHCARDDARIHLVVSADRLSAPQARNAALAHVTTTFVATLDSDDLMTPRRLEHQVAFLQQQSNAVAVGGWLTYVDPQGLPIPKQPEDDLTRPRTPAQVQYALPFYCPFLASAATLRTSALREIGGFAESSHYADDYLTLWRLSQRGGVWTMPEVVGQRRLHPGQITTRRRYSQALEVALMNRDFAEVIMGRPPSLSSVLLWTTRLGVPSQELVRKAQTELDQYHQAFLSRQPPLDDQDSAWIGQFHEGRHARLRRLSA